VVLVATDIASRGIDVNQLPCVVNFDLPYVPQRLCASGMVAPVVLVPLV